MREFLVPRYFPDFSCKMGACRRSCCEGWAITVSMRNYFRLIGLDCSDALRRRLDTALRLVDHPTEEEYARFTPNWLGDCPMRMEDGRCSLHAEMGEGVLSDVCRLYPRGVRTAVDPTEAALECSASNSCEATVELLMKEKDPMTFSVRPLAVEPPPFPGSPSIPSTVDDPGALRFSLIRAMQQRNLPLEDRLGTVREFLGTPRRTAEPAEWTELGLHLIARYGENSDSLRDWAVLLGARSCGDARAAHQDIRRFRESRPDADVFFEQLLVNHMFFTQFPFHGLSPEREADALEGVSAMLVTLVSCACAAGGEENTPADAAAALFRLIEHTRFYENYHRT
ncbi:MAG: flagellin lysine-N-methylase [Clostridia bacterium]|nr:flagellin lysine-N-methylase [Clostridia bacterium]